MFKVRGQGYEQMSSVTRCVVFLIHNTNNNILHLIANFPNSLQKGDIHILLSREDIYIYPFFMPGLKGPPGASSNRIVRSSVCLSVCLSVRSSVLLTNKVQYLKFR